MNKVKEIRNIRSAELVGYIVDDNIEVPSYNKDQVKVILEWEKDGNIIEKAYTEEEYIAYHNNEKLLESKTEALKYLADTDWAEAYKIRHDLGLELIPEYSSKWEILNKREEHKIFLKGGN